MMTKEEKEKAFAHILEKYGRPAFKAGNNIVTFARQNSKNVSEIEGMEDEELTQRWKSLVWMNCIYGQVSLNDLQRIDLMEVEMSYRKLFDDGELEKWYLEAKEELEEEL